MELNYFTYMSEYIKHPDIISKWKEEKVLGQEKVSDPSLQNTEEADTRPLL